MEEHKLLTGMLLAALVFSIGGTIITVNSIQGDAPVFGITGAATGTGTGSATVAADISISVPDSSIDLGAGTVDSGSNFAIIHSNGQANNTNGSWTNLTVDGLNVTNDGNTEINLTVSSSNSSGNGSTGFACQGQTCATTFGDQAGVNLSLLAVSNGDVCNGNGIKPPGEGLALDMIAADTEYVACECMNNEVGAGDDNLMNFYLTVGIPADAPAGTPSTTFTFTSYEPDSGFC